ncbi:STAS domain-containing protein [Nucisporomicrobium flavum]|uniref:STAS domain-containing protein n=1 Tax=Nucisporomicrobium flavum TaxID=2785915 RepID=UPI0018F671F8|nr:STAS domain-containing protein [Nucisporomicrobium flavum]
MIIERHASDDGGVRLRVAGELDMVTADELSAAVSAALADGATAVVADLSGLTFCDSSGIAAMDRSYAEAARAGRTFRITGVHPNVRLVLELTDLYDTLTGT